MSKLKIHDSDNVVVETETGFKEALTDIKKGEAVIKYGLPIGFAFMDISKGERVHTNNMKTGLTEHVEYDFRGAMPLPPVSESEYSFLGYKRADGKVGIRNDIWIIPTVGCVNKVAEKLAAECDCFAFTHPYGCSQLGDDHEITRLILSGLAHNPNAGGVLILALGCENNTMEKFKPLVEDCDQERIRYLICQEAEDEIAEGKRLISELKERASQDVRKEFPLSKLTVGLKCGGSDGYSGITANPLVGRFSDFLTSVGGSVVLTEVPEMFGAETLLMKRAISKQVFDDIVDLINNYKEYFVRHGQTVYENPSPGNLAGGITTLEDKSLGCTQKSGSSPVVGVLGYGDRVDGRGLWLLDGPGNDMVAITNLTAAGCNLILFTTGRGTPLGAPVPTLKISSNSTLTKNKPGWIDFDASGVLDGDLEIDECFLKKVISVASGEMTRNEMNGYREISIFKDGVVL
ncbi:MAG: altronate dehydratase [Clostridiales bacterium]|nr:altronate dehydratase [Clostridiales bacterium]